MLEPASRRMIRYNVYSEALVAKHYTSVCSRATLFQLVAYSLIFIPPALIAYATNDLWQSVASYREQPGLQYLDHVTVLQGELGAGGPGGEEVGVWSSFSEYNDILPPAQLLQVNVTAVENDTDGDGKQDLLILTLEVPSPPVNVTSLQLLLFFQFQLTLSSSLTMQSVAHFSQSWANSVSQIWLEAELALVQHQPLPVSHHHTKYNETLFNTSDGTAEAFQFPSVLSQQNEREMGTVLFPLHSVWEPGTGGFTAQATITYTDQTILYHPSFWQRLKFAWVQYLAIAALFWWAVRLVQSFVFQNNIILTIKHHSE